MLSVLNSYQLTALMEMLEEIHFTSMEDSLHTQAFLPSICHLQYCK